jgi:hypothetical protein
MFVWYAYRLDILATNQDPSLDATKRLAAGCIGNNRADRTCDFDELLTYIQKPGLDAAAFTPPTRVGSDLNPDIEDAVKKIMASGYSNNVDENKLLPNSGLRPSPTYHEIFDKVTDRIQLARRVLGENPAELASVRYSAAMIHYKRLQDSAKYHIPGINKKLNDEGASWVMDRADTPSHLSNADSLISKSRQRQSKCSTERNSKKSTSKPRFSLISTMTHSCKS